MADSGPAPLRLPAILQNPVNQSQRKVEAFNAQQREKAQARRDAARATEPAPGPSSNRGKRVVRRMNNANFIDNPYVVNPKRSDLTPAVPLHFHKPRAAFPANAIDRSAPILPADASRRDPFTASSQNGAFTTSLKGTRAMLRRRGRRAEVVVPAVEDVIRAWLGGEFVTSSETEGWRIIEGTLVDQTPGSSSGVNGSHRRLPTQHQVREAVPPLPAKDGQVPAVLEFSRSAAHLSWAVPDSFDRLVVHLVARYYELISWSEDQTSLAGEKVRLTHLVRPALVRARVPPPSHALLTPETSDLSAASSSDRDSSTDHGDTSDTATEHGDHSDADSVADDGDTTFRSLTERFGNASEGSMEGYSDIEAEEAARQIGSLALHRVVSPSSSAYASSEGSFSDAWVEVDSAVPVDPFSGPSSLATSPIATTISLPEVQRSLLPQRLSHNEWEDKPTFFMYLYGE